MSIAAGLSIISVVVAILIAWLLHARGRVSWPIAAGAIVMIMAVEWNLASNGALAQWSRRPPTFMLMMAAIFAVTVATVWSRAGDRIAATASFALLIGIQAFRLPLELVMHQAAVDGVMPIQMTYTGWNFDIVTGTLAIVVAWIAALGRAPRGLIIAWNLLGSLLLLNIVTIAIVSTPPIAAFGPGNLNTWVAGPPYVWLPGVLVPAALFGHLIIWRKLRQHA